MYPLEVSGLSNRYLISDAPAGNPFGNEDCRLVMPVMVCPSVTEVIFISKNGATSEVCDESTITVLVSLSQLIPTPNALLTRRKGTNVRSFII